MHAERYLQCTLCIGVRAPNRGLLAYVDAVLNLEFLARGEGRPDIARGYVLFREPKVGQVPVQFCIA
jgi:hypothetical protein